MRLVLDANVVLSAALRDGNVRKALATTDADLFAPSFLKRELEKHLPSIARRAGVRLAGARAALELLLADVVWIDDATIKAHVEEADAALGAIDPNDVPYLACALAIKADAIWSYDKDFDRQALIRRVERP